MKVSQLRIVVTGLAATYPYGGVFWDYIQYLLGLHRLGHDVLYLEDTGQWCYDPNTATFVENGGKNASLLAEHIRSFEPELAGKWSFRDATGETFGCSTAKVKEFCRSADLFIHLSAGCWIRDEHLGAAKVALVDSDPLYTQASVLGSGLPEEEDSGINWWKEHHDIFFTFGENIGKPGCTVPTGQVEWLPTRQPVVLDRFRDFVVSLDSRRRILTTVASWEPRQEGPTVNGTLYYGKSREYERFIDFPGRSPLPLEVAISGPAPLDKLRTSGWRLKPGHEVSFDPWVYRDYLAHSFGEWSVAKNAYVASRSGWFSCRTACYLALGVPAIIQDTGFTETIPVGEGLFAFLDQETAAEAIGMLCMNPARHAKSALELAHEYFDSSKVLRRLIQDAFCSDFQSKQGLKTQ